MQDTQYQAPQKIEAHSVDQALLAERMQQASAYRREDDAIDIKWLLDTIYAGRHLMAGAVGLAMLLAMSYLLVATPRYEAASQLLIESRRPKIIAGDEVAPGLDTGRFMLSQVIDSQIQLLRSPTLAERVIRELDIREFAKPKASSGGVLSWIMRPSGDAAKPELDPGLALSETEVVERQVTQSEVDAFLRGLDVRRVGLSLIIQVKYFHKDPVQAARIANAVATRYLAIQEEGRFAKTEHVRQWLKGRVGELQLKIGDGQQKIELYKFKHDLVEPEDAGHIFVSGSHGGLLGGRPETAVKYPVFAGVYCDADRGADDAGLSRLPALDDRGIAGACVSAFSARIGDGRSIYNDGIISAANETAAQHGGLIGQSCRAFVQRMVDARIKQIKGS